MNVGGYWVVRIRGRRQRSVIAWSSGNERDGSASASDRLLGLAKNLRRIGCVALEQIVDLLRRSRIDLDADLGGVGKEIGILHGRPEGRAQRAQALGRHAGRSRERTAEQKLLEQHLEHRALLIGL